MNTERTNFRAGGSARAAREPEGNSAARLTNIILGSWLVASAFIWEHSSASFLNTWIVGTLVAAVAFLGLVKPPLRYANTFVGLWLFASTLSIDHLSRGTVWHNMIVAVAVMAVSLAPLRLHGPDEKTRRGLRTRQRESHVI